MNINQNIPAKNRRIKELFPTVKRVKVSYQVQVYTLDKSDIVYQSESIAYKQALKIFKTFTHNEQERAKLLSIRSAKYVYQLVRLQSSGYVGGILLGSHRDVAKEIIL